MTQEEVDCEVCRTSHSRTAWATLGMVCSRCETHTGNNHQGHYWGFCNVTGEVEKVHFCCPDDCQFVPTVRVRKDDLRLLLYGFDNPDATAIGSRPIARLRAAVK